MCLLDDDDDDDDDDDMMMMTMKMINEQLKFLISMFAFCLL